MMLRCSSDLLFKTTRYPFNPAHLAKTMSVFLVAVLVIVGTVAGGLAADDDRRKKDKRRNNDDKVSARLSGFNEVHFSGGEGTPETLPALRGAISTTASGKFRAEIDDDARIIDYELSYEGLEGAVTQAHIHFGQRHTVGGIVVWLCQTSVEPAPLAVTPVCPSEGTVSGTITPDQVLAQNAQGFEAGDFDELVRAIRAGAAYANVHSTKFGPGEIRGHIVNGNNKDD